MVETTSIGMPFSANQGYFVSILSDEEDADDNLDLSCQNYWNQDEKEPYTQAIWSTETGRSHSGNDSGLQSYYDNYISSVRSNSFANHRTSPESCDHGGFRSSSILYLCPSQLQKSKACREASTYSLQQSFELLMGRSMYAEPEELNEYSIQGAHGKALEPIAKRSFSVCETRLQQYVNMEPTREVVTTSRVKVEPACVEDQYGQVQVEHLRTASNAASNWTRDFDDDYPDPIDMGLHYNKTQRTLPIEAKRAKMKMYNNQYKSSSNCSRSDLRIVDWKDEIGKEDTNVYYTSGFVTRQPQRVLQRTDLKTDDPTEHPSQTITHSQKRKQAFQHSRSLPRTQAGGSRKHSTNVEDTMLRSLDPVKNCCGVSERGCLSRKEHLYDVQKKGHDPSEDQIIYREKAKMQARSQRTRRQLLEAHRDKGDGRMRCKQVSSSLASPGAPNDRNGDWTLANTEGDHNHGSSKLPDCSSKRGVHGDHANTSRTSQQPVVESEATTRTNNLNQKNIKENNMGASSTLSKLNVPKCSTALERENAGVTELSSSRMAKLGVPSSRRTKDQILSALNSGRRVLQTVRKTSENAAHGLGEENKSLGHPECGPPSKILRERKLQTLNVMDYKSLERDGGTTYQTEGPHRFGVYEGGNTSLSSADGVTASENAQPKVKTWRTKKGGKENTDRTETGCAPSRLVESCVSEDQNVLEVYCPYDPNQQGEATNVEVQEQSEEEPGLFVESNSRDVIQVHVEAQGPYTELAFRSNKLLQLLQDLQLQRPTPSNCYENNNDNNNNNNNNNNTSIISTEGMTDPTPQCGYLAQYYLKMKDTGARGNKRLSTIRR